MRACVGGVIVCLLAAAASAGPLNPPAGAVAPSMKTLADVEPRTAINATNTPGDGTAVHVISTAGSYYLTGQVNCPAGKSAIRVTTQGVRIDLNGFTLSGAAGSLSGVTSGGLGAPDCAVSNGLVKGFGGKGIDLGNALQARVSGVNVRSCVGGIAVGAGALVSDCVAAGNTGAGFSSMGGRSRFRGCVSTFNTDGFLGDASFDAFDGCTATGNSNDGFQTNNALLTGCVADDNEGNGFVGSYADRYSQCRAGYNEENGFAGANNAVYDGCTAVQNELVGMSVGSVATVRSCLVVSNTQQGIKTGDRCTVTGNQVRFNGAGALAGIWCNGDQNFVESNQSTINGYGVFVSGTQNVVVRNTCGNNGVSNYVIPVGNRVGLVTTGTTNAAAINGNGGGGLGFTDPNANIAY